MRPVAAAMLLLAGCIANARGGDTGEDGTLKLAGDERKGTKAENGQIWEATCTCGHGEASEMYQGIYYCTETIDQIPVGAEAEAFDMHAEAVGNRLFNCNCRYGWGQTDACSCAAPRGDDYYWPADCTP